MLIYALSEIQISNLKKIIFLVFLTKHSLYLQNTNIDGLEEWESIDKSDESERRERIRLDDDIFNST